MEARKLPDRIGVDEFLTIDQATFGDAWRYELIDGLPVAQAAPSPRHAAIVVNISAALKRLTKPPCRPEAGSAAVPRNKSADRARIPDVMVRCDGKPKVLFEVVSPSDEKSQVQKADRYRDLRNVDGVEEIIEVIQDEAVCRVHRYRAEISGWQLDFVAGLDSELALISLGIALPMAEIYDGVFPLENG